MIVIERSLIQELVFTFVYSGCFVDEPAVSSVIAGKRSEIRDRKRGSSSSTNFDRFMSRNTLITETSRGELRDHVTSTR